MQDADNFDALGLLPHTIDDDKGRSGDHELAGAGGAPTPADFRILAQEHIGALPDGERHCQGAARAFRFDMIENDVEIGVGVVLPEDGNAHAPVPFRRAMRASSFVMTLS